MVVQTPPPTSLSTRDQEIDAGVIEDARARQRRHRSIAVTVLATAVAAGVLILGMGGGGGRGAPGRNPHGQPSGSGGVPVPGSQGNPFPGAPTTQAHGYGVSDRACPLAAPNRYLPARAGCVEVKRADLTGDGQQDLVIAYSVLGPRHPYWFVGQVPPEIAKDFVPERPYLKVVFPDGTSVSTQIRGPRGTWATAIDFLSHVGRTPGKEIFLEATRSSDGGADVVYGLRKRRLVAAGPALQYGGDSAYRAEFACLRGATPGIVQRTFVLLGPTIYGWWRETETSYSWQGPKLVQTVKRTVKEHGQPSSRDDARGSGCGPAVKDA